MSITREPLHEKLGAALNIDGPDVIAATSGYFGDAPPYQGHVVADRSRERPARERLQHALRQPPRTAGPEHAAPRATRRSSRAAARSSSPAAGRILIDTGNGPWNGTTDFGDSVLELTFPGLDLRQSFTPTNQEQLNTSDTDLGSSAPALLGEDRVVLAGKDGIMRVLALSRLDGHPPSGARLHPLGGEVQRLPIPGGGELFTAPAVWRHAGRTTVFVADEHGTAAYVLRSGRLLRGVGERHARHQPGDGRRARSTSTNRTAAASTCTGRPRRTRSPSSPGEPGHWNSPIVVDGHVVEPEGDANAHALIGKLEIFSTG